MFIYLLSIKKNTVYKLMWWIYKVRYDTMYYNYVVGYSSAMSTQVPCKSKGQHRFNLLVFTGCSSGSNSGWDGLPVCCDVYWSFHGWSNLRKGCWSLHVEYDLLHTGVHLLWLWEFWIGISAWWLCWNCWRLKCCMQLTVNGYVRNMGRKSIVTNMAMQRCETLFGLVMSVVIICTTFLNIKNRCLSPHSAFMCFVLP